MVFANQTANRLSKEKPFCAVGTLKFRDVPLTAQVLEEHEGEDDEAGQQQLGVARPHRCQQDRVDQDSNSAHTDVVVVAFIVDRP